MKIEPSTESLDNSDLNRLYLFFYLIPILGFFPSLWTLYRGTRTEQGELGKLGKLGEQSYLYEAQSPSSSHQPPATSPSSSHQPPATSHCTSHQPPATSHSTSHQPLATSHFTSHQPLATSHSISRLSVTLAFAWLLGYLLLNIGAETSEFLTLRLLVLNSLLTSGYFLVSIWLMVRLASGSSVRLPGFSSLAERVFGKHLS